MYAQLCKRLSDEAPNFEAPGQSRVFLRLLLNICRDKFENRYRRSDISNGGYVGESNILLDAEERKLRTKQKMLGNVKFIGELSKLDMLTGSILHNCIQQLFDKSNPNATIQDRCEDMECLSQLIRTCGKILDTEKGKKLMDQYFEKMAKSSVSPKYPPRIRFMLRDVIELRNNGWIPRKVSNVEGPVPIQQLRTEEDDIIRPTYVNRSRDHRNSDRDTDNWMNKLPLNLQSGLNDVFSGLTVSSSPHIIPPYNSNTANNYNNRDHRDGGPGGGGGFRHNNQRNNQNHNIHNNFNNHNRYNKHNNHNNQHNNSHNNYSNSNMMNNKDLAPRFKKNLITPPQDPVENLTFRPAANSLLFKANMNIKASQLPLSQLRPMTQAMSFTHNIHTPDREQQQQQINSSQHQQQKPHQLVHTQSNVQTTPTSTMSSPLMTTIKITNTVNTPINNIINKDQILIKQASLEKSKQTKKDKGPNKEEVLKRVLTFLNDTLLNTNLENERNMDDIIASFIDLKVPDKFMRDTITTVLNEIVDRNEEAHDRVFEFLLCLKKELKIMHNAILEGYKSLINNMNDNPIPRIATLIATLLCRGVEMELCKLTDIANWTENGQHYPLFLLVLQQLHIKLGQQKLQEIYTNSKVNLISSLPEADRTKDRMAKILEERRLSFLYPLLKVQGELQKQLQDEQNPQLLYKWIKDNVDSAYFVDPGFITALMTVLLKYITSETTLANGIDPTTLPNKELCDKEKSLLDKFRFVLIPFLNRNDDLQLVAIYALQVYCYSVDFPKGMLLRWFQALYDFNIITEEAFLRWKEESVDVCPGKGNALFQVNSWLLWLAEAESEDEEDAE